VEEPDSRRCPGLPDEPPGAARSGPMERGKVGRLCRVHAVRSPSPYQLVRLFGEHYVLDLPPEHQVLSNLCNPYGVVDVSSPVTSILLNLPELELKSKLHPQVFNMWVALGLVVLLINTHLVP
jgi:hypothetical protein